MAPSATSSLSFKTTRDGDSITSLCSSFPRVTPLPVKKFFLLSDVLVLWRSMSPSIQLSRGAEGPVWVQGLCRPRGREHIPPAPIAASCTEVQRRQGWPILACVTAAPCPKTQQVSLVVWQLCQLLFYIFFNFLRQPSGELHYVCECCPSVSLPQPQQVSLTIWQMQCWGREGFCVRVFAGPLGDTHHVANTAMKALVRRG